MADATHSGALNQAQTAIRALITATTITDIVSASVLVRTVPTFERFGADTGQDDIDYAFPGIIIAPFGQEKIEPDTNKHDFRGYPVLVVIAYQQTTASVATHADYAPDPFLDNREIIVNEFLKQRLAASDPAVTFTDCDLEPTPIIDPQRYSWEKLIVSPLLFRFWIRQQTGN